MRVRSVTCRTCDSRAADREFSYSEAERRFRRIRFCFVENVVFLGAFCSQDRFDGQGQNRQGQYRQGQYRHNWIQDIIRSPGNYNCKKDGKRP
jgi:hypothetical protein